MKKILIIITSVLFLIALFMTFLGPVRYGVHGDNRPCGDNPEKRYFYTAIEYFVFADDSLPNSAQTGTCPYQYYEAQTFALEFWTGAVISALILYRKSRSK